MTKELAKTLTTALVQFIDRERPEGTMCCSNAECKSIEQMFEGGCYDVIESFIKKKLSRLTEFQNAVRVMITEALTTHIKDGNGREMTGTVFISNDTAILLSAGLLELAKNELLSRADESNPKIEAMADLKRTFMCNPDKLPLWLKNEIESIRIDAHTKGYNKGYKAAEEEYNKSVAFHYPEHVPTGVAYKSPQCYTDVLITPNTNPGTSTLKSDG